MSDEKVLVKRDNGSVMTDTLPNPNTLKAASNIYIKNDQCESITIKDEHGSIVGNVNSGKKVVIGTHSIKRKDNSFCSEEEYELEYFVTQVNHDPMD